MGLVSDGKAIYFLEGGHIVVSTKDVSVKNVVRVSARHMSEQLRDAERGDWHPGRISIQVAVIKRAQGMQGSGGEGKQRRWWHFRRSKHDQQYERALKLLGLKDIDPRYGVQYLFGDSSIICLPGNRLVNTYTLVAMMQSWVCNCLGEDYEGHLPPVAYNDADERNIQEGFRGIYGCSPEESGYSPRAGSVVVELSCADAGFVVQINVTCLSALGAEQDMQIARSGMKVAVAKIRNGLRGECKLVVSGSYPPNMEFGD